MMNATISKYIGSEWNLRRGQFAMNEMNATPEKKNILSFCFWFERIWTDRNHPTRDQPSSLASKETTTTATTVAKQQTNIK